LNTDRVIAASISPGVPSPPLQQPWNELQRRLRSIIIIMPPTISPCMQNGFPTPSVHGGISRLLPTESDSGTGQWSVAGSYQLNGTGTAIGTGLANTRRRAQLIVRAISLAAPGHPSPQTAEVAAAPEGRRDPPQSSITFAWSNANDSPPISLIGTTLTAAASSPALGSPSARALNTVVIV
jgi:hypothetical protein